MEIINPRLKWNGVFTPLNKNKINGIALHHMDASKCTIYDVHKWHLDNGWIGCGYAFFVSKLGVVFLGRGFNQNAGVFNENGHLISIGFEGEYQKIDKVMPLDQFNSGVEIIKYVLSQCPNVGLIDGHKRWTETTCPGNNFPLREIVSSSWNTTPIDNKNYNLDANQIIDLIAKDSEGWKKFINAIESSAKSVGNIGDLEVGVWIKVLIQKIWKYKGNKNYSLTADQIVELISTDPYSWVVFMNTIETLAKAEGSIGDLEIGAWIKTLVVNIWNYK